MQTAQETEPNNPEVADTGGWIYFKMQAYSKAISLLKDSAEQAADNPVIRYHLGMAYYHKGDLRAAREAYSKPCV